MSEGAGADHRLEVPEPVREWMERHPMCALGAAVTIVNDPAVRPTTECDAGRELVAMRRQMDRLEAGFADRALAANRLGVGLADGHVSTPGWIAWQTGLPRPAVGRVLRHAELVELLPGTGSAWRDGRITSTAVEMIGQARVTGHDEELVAVEGEFLDRARRGDHKSLKILTRHFAECARADGTKPAPPDGMSFTEVGTRWVLRGEFANTADAQTISEALDAFARRPAADDPTTRTQRRAEGFVRMCEIALRRGTDSDPSRPVVSYITHETTPDDAMPPLTIGTLTGVIPPGERDRVLCDAIVATITTTPAGEIVDVGRATRTWPTATRRLITTIHPHCLWPGCDIPADHCDLHHHIPWEHGGPTDTTNGYPQCRRHHTFLHAHPDWTITYDGTHLRVHRPDGTRLHPDPWTGHWAA
ncbi:MAG: DUF222 domain-containing protein [Acidimicrobiia bacterium]